MNYEITVFSVFVAGLVSFFSPCVLPLIPAYIGYISGGSQNQKRIISRSLGFILGFTLVFISMGATATFIGQYILMNKFLLMKIGGAILIILGLNMTGVFSISMLSVEKRKRMPKSINWFSSILIGMVFAAGWTPCIGPLLGSVLVYASQASTLNQGILYLFIYSMGIGIPFFISALLFKKIDAIIKKFGKGSVVIKKIAGLIIVIFGLLMFFNRLDIFYTL